MALEKIVNTAKAGTGLFVGAAAGILDAAYDVYHGPAFYGAGLTSVAILGIHQNNNKSNMIRDGLNTAFGFGAGYELLYGITSTIKHKIF